MRSLWRKRLSLSALNHVTRLQLLCHIPSLMIRVPWLCFVFSSSFPGRLASISSASWRMRAEMLQRSGGSSDSSAWRWVMVRHIGMLTSGVASRDGVWRLISGWNQFFCIFIFLIAFSPFHHLSFLQSTSPWQCHAPVYTRVFAKHVVYSGASRIVAPKMSLQELQTHHFNGFTALFRRCDKSQNFISSPAY